MRAYVTVNTHISLALVRVSTQIPKSALLESVHMCVWISVFRKATDTLWKSSLVDFPRVETSITLCSAHQLLNLADMMGFAVGQRTVSFISFLAITFEMLKGIW